MVNDGKVSIWVAPFLGLRVEQDNLPHNTCQIYVKSHHKNIQMTLECQIFDEKALE